MRILYLSNARIPSPTANSIQVMKVCAAFGKIGHYVTLVARAGQWTEKGFDVYTHYGVDSSFPVIRLTVCRGRLGKIEYSIKSGRFLRKNRKNFDVAYGRSAHALLVAAMFHLPIIYEIHTPPATVFRNWLEHLLFRSRHLKRLVFISKALQDEYLTRLGGSLIFNYIVAHDGADSYPIEAITRLPLPGRPRALHAGYVGHLYPGKGAEILIALAKELPDWEFHIVGGLENDIKRIRHIAEVPNLHLHGYVPPRATANYLASMDVLLLPAKNKVTVGGKGDIAPWMSPLKLFEYMSSGKPIVASRLPVLEEVLEDGHNCLLAEPDNLNSWIRGLIKLGENKHLATTLSSNALRDLEDYYSWEKRAKVVLDDIG
jgi:glycosyltransferase involved in cell wall biosynthesis